MTRVPEPITHDAPDRADSDADSGADTTADTDRLRFHRFEEMLRGAYEPGTMLRYGDYLLSNVGTATRSVWRVSHAPPADPSDSSDSSDSADTTDTTDPADTTDTPAPRPLDAINADAVSSARELARLVDDRIARDSDPSDTTDTADTTDTTDFTSTT
jgi:hypothetical protein